MRQRLLRDTQLTGQLLLCQPVFLASLSFASSERFENPFVFGFHGQWKQHGAGMKITQVLMRMTLLIS